MIRRIVIVTTELTRAAAYLPINGSPTNGMYWAIPGFINCGDASLSMSRARAITQVAVFVITMNALVQSPLAEPPLLITVSRARTLSSGPINPSNTACVVIIIGVGVRSIMDAVMARTIAVSSGASTALTTAIMETSLMRLSLKPSILSSSPPVVVFPITEIASGERSMYISSIVKYMVR